MRAEVSDSAAESAVIAFLFTYPARANVVRDHLIVGDFTDLRWQRVYGAWRPDLHYRDLSDLTGVPTTNIEAAIADGPSPGTVVPLVRRLLDLSARRQTKHFAAELSAAADDPGIGAEDLVLKAQAGAGELTAPLVIAEPDVNVDGYLAGFDDSYDWLIPDFLERGDRMLVTGGEGAGKSVLLAQFAVCVAAGLHPWHFKPVDASKVLYIDLENGERLVKRRLNDLRSKVPDMNPDNLRVISRVGGLDITKRNDAVWLAERVAANEPDLLVIGPAYRLFSGVAEKGDVGAEGKARETTATLDRIREQTRCALLMETHAPHGEKGGSRDLRPFGSSVWLRWPEFGVGIKGTDNPKRFKLIHWRGPRDARIWPEYLDRGNVWPWQGSYPTGTFK